MKPVQQRGLRVYWGVCLLVLWGGERVWSAEGPQGGEGKLVVYPAEVKLTGRRAEQRLVVLGPAGAGGVRDWSREAQWQVENEQVAAVEGGVVRPRGDGQTVVRVRAGGQEAAVPVRVERYAADELVDFVREVEPILTKAGCNSGGCHGAALGRGGFRLSLFGFDPAFDYAQIVRSSEGRRVVVAEPDRSILLAKPALVMEHGGGERLRRGSRDYEVLAQWLADGAPGPSGTDVEVVGLEVFPPARSLGNGEQQQLAVTAIWSDGRRTDATRHAQYDSLNEGVAEVTSDGLVRAKGPGQTHIMIRFGGQASVAQITWPYARLTSFPEYPTENIIDRLLVEKWKELGLTPSPVCSDEEFLRRLYLDALGRLPTPAEVRAFLADSGADKRQRAVETVLQRGEFADWWALRWGDLLRINRTALQEKGMWSFHNWVRAQMRDNVPLDRFVREIITAEGSTFMDGPANFFRIGRTAEDWAESTAQVFLGIRIGCARCHHHPFEKWSQDDYYGLTAFFVRIGTKGSQEFGLFGQETVVFVRSTGEAMHPRRGSFVAPRPLDGDKKQSWDDPLDRRFRLAEWLTSPENRLFARNLANRIWGYTMGRGLVEPLDDMRATNPPVHPALLEALADELIRSKYDLKHLLRLIFTSRAYQLSAQVTPGNQADAANVYFTRRVVRRLTAEQLADALDDLTGSPEKYPGLPPGTRAVQLPDSEVASYFLDTFGRPARQVLCECERTSTPNLAQAMHLLNGAVLQRKLADPNGRIDKLLAAKTPLPQIVEELYLAAWSRRPSADELKKAESWVRSAPNLREGLQDLVWVLANSREFLFNY
ncbi:DUF1549 domain-containing protein [Thermogemmata fonticola]|uniref:DUF1553 domain-containing protein n=1 Tax=Thermogemmata fonticola TaxID=2755323 RepID=A0A7V9ADJ1_9BACT|nr:DUF1549 domain-containing protein [Thermogemmata fonticola]MBA2227887.1 DUF1553 domain-containing protein [Thermogemmata fonticola]